MKLLRQLISREECATAVEYAVLLALIIMMCISAITLVGGQTVNYWANNRDQINAAMGS